MTDKIKIPAETWVGLYAELSDYVEQCSGVEPVYDENGQRTPESDDKICKIVDDIESILSDFFIKEK